MFWKAPLTREPIPVPYLADVAVGRALMFGALPLLYTADPTCRDSSTLSSTCYATADFSVTIYHALNRTEVIFAPAAKYVYEGSSDTAHMIFEDGSEYDKARCGNGSTFVRYSYPDGTWCSSVLDANGNETHRTQHVSEYSEAA